MKLEISLAIDANGDWHAYGGKDVSQDEALSECLGNIHDGLPTKVYNLIVDIPVPTPEDLTVRQIAPVAAAEFEAVANKYFQEHKAHIERMNQQYKRLNPL
jgi:hypothetical protein